ncbi:hypothetical protein [Sphingomonas sp. URHD0057]|uniref:hypothetical protein n=1 Tax=Sphingomonas sp. URHD0057 TaxID=1380389 RepID=UPI00048D782B|nr:hypothetical protein [Sphingomonas sp. URHD0057]
MTDDQAHRRLINLGELIAIAALAVSAVGVWIAWKSSSEDKPTRVVEQRQAIPLTLRGTVQDEGRALVIEPIEQSHALESLTLTIKGASPIELGSDGRLDAGSVESAIGDKDDAKGAHSLPVRIDARYVEMGKDRRGGGSYVLRYRWEGGGLFGGRSLRLTGFGR